jgi:ferritin-like metal-binding protein YciE
MEGLLTEGAELLEEHAESDALDAAMIAAAQRVEHYEIAGYGTVRTFANMLGLPEHAELLQKTLDEEGKTDHQLTELAETVVNIDAVKE